MPPKRRKLPDWFLNQSGRQKESKEIQKKKKKSDPIKRTIYMMSPEEFMLLSTKLAEEGGEFAQDIKGKKDVDKECEKNFDKCVTPKKVENETKTLKRITIDIDSPADDIFSTGSSDGISPKQMISPTSSTCDIKTETKLIKVSETTGSKAPEEKIALIEAKKSFEKNIDLATKTNASSANLHPTMLRNDSLSLPKESVSSTFNSRSDTVPVPCSHEYSIFDELMNQLTMEYYLLDHWSSWETNECLHLKLMDTLDYLEGLIDHYHSKNEIITIKEEPLLDDYVFDDNNNVSNLEICSIKNESDSLFIEMRDDFGELSNEEMTICGETKANEEKRFKCIHCSKCFVDLSNLSKHEKIHEKDKIFNCELCEEAFSVQKELKNHIKVLHTENMQHKCEICSKCFKRAYNLSRHIQIHSKEKTYKCELCDKSYAVQYDLKRHLRTHTGDLPYICEVCGKSFNRSNDLLVHTRIHTKEKPYECLLCSKQFSLKSHLRRHERLIHAEQ